MRDSQSLNQENNHLDVLKVNINILPVLIKKGIRKRPDKTLSLKDCNVAPSNGKAPQTRTCFKSVKIDVV